MESVYGKKGEGGAKELLTQQTNKRIIGGPGHLLFLGGGEREKDFIMQIASIVSCGGGRWPM